MLKSLPRVLVVDDDGDWVDLITELLLAEGYEVEGAPDGGAALELVPRFGPFVVVTDVQMPVMDGKELLSRLHAADQRLPVIVVTGNASPEVVAGMPEAFRVLGKLEVPKGLLAVVAAACAHRAERLPLQKLWAAAKEKPKPRATRRKNVVQRILASVIPPLSPARGVLLALALVSSAILLSRLGSRAAI